MDIEKMVQDAQKNVKAFINKEATRLIKLTKNDFEKSAKTLGLEKEFKEAREETKVSK